MSPGAVPPFSWSGADHDGPGSERRLMSERRLSWSAPEPILPASDPPTAGPVCRWLAAGDEADFLDAAWLRPPSDGGMANERARDERRAWTSAALMDATREDAVMFLGASHEDRGLMELERLAACRCLERSAIDAQAVLSASR
mmetsp:Transcript_39067/g.101303  ORF Transcript_39067/g.101303 Transcript_39067/m.101303 type:complete len:143 (-) Transcript_39067:37-465(-)